MRLCELRDKEVINICSGRRLGCIVDVELNVCSGEVEAVIIPGPGQTVNISSRLRVFGRLDRTSSSWRYRKKSFCKSFSDCV